MPNPWFQFKQFTVQQDRCAMKVSTDACIQGAWAAPYLARLQSRQPGPLQVLDIGTGTGLLSLMLAQQAPEALFHAIELNEEACEQATENFARARWHRQLQAQHIALEDFAAQPGRQDHYDFIICNPPFFHNHLQAQQQARNDARHSTALDKETLAHSIVLLLKPAGKCCVMYPATEWEDWITTAAAQGLYPSAILEVRPGAQYKVNRVIGIFGRQQPERRQVQELIIYEPDRQYTPNFRALLAPYYLAL